LPKTGQAWQRVEPFLLPGKVPTVFRGQARAGPNKTHFPPKDIEELRQLIQTRRAKEPSKGYQPNVSMCVQFGHGNIGLNEAGDVRFVNGRIRAGGHGSKFEHYKWLSAKTNSFLSEEHRPFGTDFDENGNQQH
jgi:hypothetical protein